MPSMLAIMFPMPYIVTERAKGGLGPAPEKFSQLNSLQYQKIPHRKDEKKTPNDQDSRL